MRALVEVDGEQRLTRLKMCQENQADLCKLPNHIQKIGRGVWQNALLDKRMPLTRCHNKHYFILKFRLSGDWHFLLDPIATRS